PDLSLRGMERALTDIDAVMDVLAQRPEVDTRHMLIAGVSRGGILAVVYAGTRPGRFQAAINFVGGWMNDRCFNVDAINTASFRRGGAFAGPTLWMYAQNDSFYRISHSQKNFDAFIAAGGRGAFNVATLPYGTNGHGVLSFPDQWSDKVLALLAQLDGNQGPR